MKLAMRVTTCLGGTEAEVTQALFVPRFLRDVSGHYWYCFVAVLGY